MSTTENKRLNFFNVAVMYVGTIMGAGFASGREAWQFFGIFGKKAYIGIAFATVLFMVLGVMVSYIAAKLKTDDMGKIIVFSGDPRAENLVGCLMAAILYTIIISMSAAGGSFLNQQFGIHKAVGGAVIVALVIITVLGDFDRISKVFRLIIPALFAVVVGCSIIVLFKDIDQSGATSGFPASSMAPNWFIAAFIFISYNMLGMIPMVAAASLNARNTKHAVAGSGLGGMMLGIMTIVLILALQKDMAFSQSLDLPMLGYSAKISSLANILYGVVLFAAIYSAATSTYYGFSTKLPNSPKKKYIIIAGACLGFFFGLSGFKTIVAYLYPIEGYIGLVIIVSIVISFIMTLKGKRKMTEEKHTQKYQSDIYENYPGHDRFDYPENMERVTAGFGGESIMIFGSEKTALYDSGMAYCHEGLLANISAALKKHNRDKVDIILLSHTHYDHIGALPYIIAEFPEIEVVASEKAKYVFSRDGAKRTMKRLGEAARDQFSDSGEPVSVEGLRVDRTVKENDRIYIGDEYFVVLETKGHTDCSLSFVLEPDSIMFTSESTGVLRNPKKLHTAILKSYKDTIESAEKCKAYGAKQLIMPHYGILPAGITDEIFDMYVWYAEDEKNFILKCRDSGMNKEEIFKAFDGKYWSEKRGRAQPRAAFEENAKYSIQHILDTF